MLKAIVFDFDGTIVDSLSIVLDIIKVLAKKYSYERELEECGSMSKEELKEFSRTMSMRQGIEKFNIPMAKVPLYVSDGKKMLFDKMDDMQVFSGMKKIIESLSQDYKVCLLSSNNNRFLLKFLKQHEIIECFSELSTGISIFGKARKINRLLGKLKLKPSEVIYVGDESRDIEACKKVGVKIIAVTWGYDSKKVLNKAKPDFIADKPKDILKIIKNETKKTTKKAKGK